MKVCSMKVYFHRDPIGAVPGLENSLRFVCEKGVLLLHLPAPAVPLLLLVCSATATTTATTATIATTAATAATAATTTATPLPVRYSYHYCYLPLRLLHYS